MTSSLRLPESRWSSDSSVPPYEGIGLTEGDAAINVGSQTAHMLTGLDLRKDHYFPLDVVLNEVTWMGTTASSADEWIERYNNTGSPVDPSGRALSAADGSPPIPLSDFIPGGGHFLLERTDDTTVPDVSADQTYSGGLGNDGEDLFLRGATTNLIDHVDCASRGGLPVTLKLAC